MGGFDCSRALNACVIETRRREEREGSSSGSVEIGGRMTWQSDQNNVLSAEEIPPMAEARKGAIERKKNERKGTRRKTRPARHGQVF